MECGHKLVKANWEVDGTKADLCKGPLLSIIWRPVTDSYFDSEFPFSAYQKKKMSPRFWYSWQQNCETPYFVFPLTFPLPPV